MRTVIACAAVVAALATTGCWWPIREGGHGRDERSYGERQAPERRGDQEGHRGHEGHEERGEEHR